MSERFDGVNFLYSRGLQAFWPLATTNASCLSASKSFPGRAPCLLVFVKLVWLTILRSRACLLPLWRSGRSPFLFLSPSSLDLFTSLHFTGEESTGRGPTPRRPFPDCAVEEALGSVEGSAFNERSLSLSSFSRVERSFSKICFVANRFSIPNVFPR